MKERYDNWAIRLNAHITNIVTGDPFVFEWGTFDCCIFVADVVLTITGEDPMAEFRGQYDTEEGSKEALKTIGNGTLYRTLTHKFGKALPGVKGHTGDIGYYEGSCGIIFGRFGIFLREEGLAYVRLSLIERSFKVGR